MAWRRLMIGAMAWVSLGIALVVVLIWIQCALPASVRMQPKFFLLGGLSSPVNGFCELFDASGPVVTVQFAQDPSLYGMPATTQPTPSPATSSQQPTQLGALTTTYFTEVGKGIGRSVRLDLLGFRWDMEPKMSWGGGGGRVDFAYGVEVMIPYWLMLVVFGIGPTVWWVGRVRRRRATAREMRNCCRKCGYDLRATPERCPECGEVRAEGAVVG